ncbi:MAG TPA: sigma-54 dependent transcriptional regulator [Gammaproteobacteria bacterium]|nr:sigma-54 dependent transcriptional regulator [Gammaproteobacteria bacterium]
MSARILVVDDEANIRALIDEILSEEGYDVTTAADAKHARAARKEHEFDLVLLDIWMPDTDGISLLKEWTESGESGTVVMMSGHGTVDTAVEATRLGAFDFIEKPVSLAKLLRTVEKALAARRTKDQRRTALAQTPSPAGKSQPMRALREQIARVAQHDAHVLITGEPGSGRELYARHLASQSAQARAPFVMVLGGDFSADDAQRQLLGDGSQPGALERAAGGVLFIKELGDVSPTAQRLLLGALEQRAYRPTGGSADRPLKIRIVSSAYPGFERGEAVRRELLSHLSVVVIRVPALREYSEDVPELLRYHVDLLVEEEGLPFRRFSVAAQNRLRNYPWPGNVRELKNLVNRLLILGGEEEIALAEVEAQVAAGAAEGEPLVKQDLLAMPLREAREHFERAYLQQQLMLCGGKVGQLAKRVGMERTHLYRKLRSLGVDFRQSVTDE